MSSLILDARAAVTLIDRNAPTVTPVTIDGDTTGSMGTGSRYFVDIHLTSSGVKRTRHGTLKVRSVDGIFITNGPILIDSQTKSNFWIDAQIIQKDENGADVVGELFRMQIGTPIVENTDKGLFLTVPLTGIEYRLRESLDSEQLILTTPKDAFITRINNYFDHAGPNAPLIFVNNTNDIELPDSEFLKQNWLSQGPITAQRSVVEIIERLANPAVVGGSFQDFYFYFEPDVSATKSVIVKAEEFGARSSGVVLDVLGTGDSTNENRQTFQTDNLKFKNVAIVRGANSGHRLPMEHSRFASDVEHAKVSSFWNSGTAYVVGEYVQFDIGGGDIELFKCIQDIVLPSQPPNIATNFWNNLSTTNEFSPWTNDVDFWQTNFAGQSNPPAGYEGFALDMNLARANYDRTDAYNEFEEISFKWVTKVGVNDPDNEPADEIFDGQRYIVGSTPTGDFSGKASLLAQFDTSNPQNPVWRFSKAPVFSAGDPPTQDSVLDLNTGQVYKWSGSSWIVAWTLDTNSGVSSPLHPIKAIENVTGATGVLSAIEFTYDWDTFSDVRNQASRGAWWHLFFPFPRQAGSGKDVGDLYKQPILDFTNLDVTPKGLTGWNQGQDSEDLGTLRGINVKVRLSLSDDNDDLINFIYDLPLIFWFLDKFDRIVYTETKVRRNGEWDTIAFPAGPEAEMQLYDNRIDELVQLLGYTLPFNFFLQEKEYTGVRFDWRNVKAMGCFYKDAYDQNFFYKNAENDLFENFIQHASQQLFNLISTFEEPVVSLVFDNAKLALDELTFIKDAYASSEDSENVDSRQQIVSLTAQTDYLNMKILAQGVQARSAFFPQFQTLDAYGDVRLRLGLTFVAEGTRVPNSPLTMVVGEVTHSITQTEGYRVSIIGVNKFTISS